MIPQTLYKTDEILNICNGSLRYCDFDFSKIDYDDYTGLFNGLPNIVYKKVDSIRFSTDFQQQCLIATEVSEEDRQILDQSIALNRKRYNHYLYHILNNMLPKGKQIRSLCIDHIDIPSKYVNDFIHSCSVCPTLREFELDNVDLQDEAFLLLLEKFSPFKFTKIVLRRCGITDEVDEKVCDFLSVENNNKKWHLEIFDLSDNGFSPDELKNYLQILKYQVQHQLTSQAVEPPEILSELSTSYQESDENDREEEEEEEEANDEKTELSENSLTHGNDSIPTPLSTNDTPSTNEQLSTQSKDEERSEKSVSQSKSVSRSQSKSVSKSGSKPISVSKSVSKSKK
ncbi:hypothetical protein TRFO_42742 [Tritrichomonas foetus]|uniref:Uncharacterized protein n=1 Tax=Tritrichomonas foetus TaxID=1144522 RepID=A0A1J4KV79_9EUKA|nr:hypothetical protein TRFO_42742 [Tritrichomonas foetus]|eukprot:OHT15050.1 hypothetical protein TRFO_42742 [Tritrichomonas foetus]